MITVVMVKHSGNQNKYLFRVPDGHKIASGTRIIVDTRYGLKEAVAIANSMDIESEEAAVAIFKGVTLPLKRVLMKEKPGWEPLREIPFAQKPLEFMF